MFSNYIGKIIHNYQIDRILPSNSHCPIFEATYINPKDNTKTEKSIIRLIFKQEMDRYFKEFYKMKLTSYQKIQHSNLIQINEAFESDLYLFLVYEYCSGGNLEDYLKKKNYMIEEKKLLKIVKQMLTGCYILCKNDMKFRDYKLSSMLIKDGRIKIGESLKFMHDSTYFYADQREYLAPEILSSGESKRCIKSEIWSLGVSIYLLIYGEFPFKGTNDYTLYENIINKTKLDYIKKNKDYQLKSENLFKSLFEKIFVVDLEKRIDYEELYNNILRTNEFEDQKKKKSIIFSKEINLNDSEKITEKIHEIKNRNLEDSYKERSNSLINCPQNDKTIDQKLNIKNNFFKCNIYQE